MSRDKNANYPNSTNRHNQLPARKSKKPNHVELFGRHSADKTLAQAE
jgi:hypothetical protein